MADEQVEKLVQIILTVKGVEKAEKDLQRVKDAAAKGTEESAKAASDALPKLERFYGRWGEQLKAVGDRLGGFAGTVDDGLQKLSETWKGTTGDLVDGSQAALPEIEKFYDRWGAQLGSIGDTLSDKARNVDTTVQRMSDRWRTTMDLNADIARRKKADIDTFLIRWRHQLMLIAGAITAIWGLSKYSTVASTAMSLFGTVLGLIVDTILISLLPEIIWLVDWLVELQETVDGLPDPVKRLAAMLFLLAGAFGALKATGILGGLTALAGWGIKSIAALFGITSTGGIVATLEVMLAAGGLAAATAFGVAVLAGLAIAFVAIHLFVKSGVSDMVAAMGDEAEKQHPRMMSIAKILLEPFGRVMQVVVYAAALEFDKIPGALEQVATETQTAWENLWREMIYGLLGFDENATGVSENVRRQVDLMIIAFSNLSHAIKNLFSGDIFGAWDHAKTAWDAGTQWYNTAMYGSPEGGQGAGGRSGDNVYGSSDLLADYYARMYAQSPETANLTASKPSSEGLAYNTTPEYWEDYLKNAGLTYGYTYEPAALPEQTAPETTEKEDTRHISYAHPQVKTDVPVFSTRYAGMYPSGGYVGKTGLAYVEEGEYIQNKYETRHRINAPTSATNDTEGKIVIHQLVLQGMWTTEEKVYKALISRLQREGRRVV